MVWDGTSNKIRVRDRPQEKEIRKEEKRRYEGWGGHFNSAMRSSGACMSPGGASIRRRKDSTRLVPRSCRVGGPEGGGGKRVSEQTSSAAVEIREGEEAT